MRHMKAFALFSGGEKRLEDLARQRFRETGVQRCATTVASSIARFDEMRDAISGNESGQIETLKKTHD
ncbi:hypothetical protein [Caballeronia fortuita]|uniref:hypothetical protein n=1 Tax=Caballeronia fortuita TaxID=1777138 RepID=UPI0012FD1E55|nr:hypothetical protein [Caballeronia fortuita]